MNISMLMPNSPIGAIVSGCEIVTMPISGQRSAKTAGPNGPVNMPTSMKPSTGLTRSR